VPNVIIGDPKDQAKIKADQTSNITKNVKDPKLQGALKKSVNGQSMSSDEQKAAANAIMGSIQNEHYRRYGRYLTESEIQQAQVVLASQDMVDQVQKMIEQITSLQFKDLPALVDQVKNEVGPEQANQFNTEAGQAFGGLVQNLQGCKQQLESALGVVTGNGAPSIPGQDDFGGPDLGGDDLGGDLGAPDLGGDEDIDTDIDVDIDDEKLKPPTAGLGRNRR